MAYRYNCLKCALLSFSILSLSSCVEPVYDAMGWSQDVAIREAWKTRALRGDAEAQYHVGKNYCCGESPRYNNVAALYWFCKAAKNGQRDAMFEIGKIYDNANKVEGSIIPYDKVRAYTYYKLAEKNHQFQATPYKNRAEVKLSAAEKKRANDLIAIWPETPCTIARGTAADTIRQIEADFDD